MILSAKKELLNLPTANGHASCVARVNGETWITWFGGTKEGDSDVDIYLARKTAAGWTEPIRITADENLPHWNPVLLPRGDGADLFFKLGATIPGWKTMRVHLDGEGQPTGEPHELVEGDIGGRGPVRNKCLTLTDGRILAPASIETKEPARWRDAACAADFFAFPRTDEPLRWKPFVDISTDGGETFSQAAPVPLMAGSERDEPDALPAPVGGVFSAEGHAPCRVRRLGAIQPALWQTKDGHIHMLLRSSEGAVLRSDSKDGVVWSAASVTALPNNNSGIDLVQLEDGRILLCLNPVSGDWAARTPLSLFISTDDGTTFRPLMNLEMSEGEYSYPSLDTEGNTVYLSYTWNREKICLWTMELEERA
ncbi:MAG: exo-alpha-sialidase [Clostridia bacterium]|nr:exo-alpha-sialidase [Clostridia bacterium]